LEFRVKKPYDHSALLFELFLIGFAAMPFAVRKNCAFSTSSKKHRGSAEKEKEGPTNFAAL
jgi:hypothetical protein